MFPLSFGTLELTDSEKGKTINYLETLSMLGPQKDVYGIVHTKQLTIFTDDKRLCDNANQNTGRIFTQLQALVSSSGCNLIHLRARKGNQLIEMVDSWG